MGDAEGAGQEGEPWTGVRNYLARNNMRAMQLGDLGFFYHSNDGKEIVGIVRVIALAHPDARTDDTGTWECVDVEAVCDLPKPVTLADVKANPKLANMRLVTSMRLSVQPVTAAEWVEVCRMGGLDPKKIGRSMSPEDADRLIHAHTTVQTLKLVPELKLRLAARPQKIWEDVERSAPDPLASRPFWAFAWPGGQATARFLFDNPHGSRANRCLILAAARGLARLRRCGPGTARARE